MTTRQVTPPWKFLREASERALETYELSRLNHAANLRREISALLDQWVQDNSEALLARWMRGHSRSDAMPLEEISQRNLPFTDVPSGAMRTPGANRVLRLPRRN